MKQDVPSGTGEAYVGAATAWYGVAVLTLAQALSGLDRNILNILVEPIKRDLHISDTSMGMLLGVAFALFYASMALPMGRLADAKPRKYVIAVGMAAWTVATASCGLVNSFVQLFFARMAVGVGESALNPCGFTMITDYFPPERRARPLAIFIGGQSVGAAAAIFGGGKLIEYLAQHHIVVTLPYFGVMAPWQIAMICASAPGILMVLLVLSMTEPSRKTAMSASTDMGQATQPARPAAMARYFWKHVDIYLPLFVAMGLMMFLELGKVAWMPTFLIRGLHWSPGEVGARLGLISLVVPIAGTFLGAWVIDSIAARGHRISSMKVALYLYGALMPLLAIAFIVPSQSLAILLILPSYMIAGLPLVVATSMIALLTPPNMRAQFTAAYLLTLNTIGYGLGPLTVGFLSEHLFPTHDGIRYALTTAAAIAIPPALFLFWLAIRNFRCLIRDSAPFSI